MKKLIYLLAASLLSSSFVQAESCKFRYWEVIPNTVNCQTFYLPDFEFRSIPDDNKAPEHIKRFCSQYEIHSKYGTQKIGYCYTGEGDRSGPKFRLGDEHANILLDHVDGRDYMADLNFIGCVEGKKVEGKVFVVGDWRAAPKSIKRIWPLEQGDSGCTR